MPRADDLPDPATNGAGPLDLIAEALGRLRYGAIQLTVHDGKVMQIDVTERRRIQS
jgi:hypothetical protein